MRILLLLALLMGAIQLQATEKIIPFKLSTANGLPDNDIRRLAQDKVGNIYLSTSYAYYTYDGYSFRTVPDSLFHKYRINHDDLLRHGSTTDNLGNRIDLGANGNIVYHDRRSGETLRMAVFTPAMLSLSDNLKIKVATTRSGHIWVSVNGNGLFLYNRQTRQMRHIVRGGVERLIDTNYITDMLLDHDDNLWVSQDHYGLVRLNIIDEHHVVRPDESDGNERMNNIRMMRRMNSNTILVADKDGNLYKADGQLHYLRKVGSGTNILSATTDSKGRLWLGSQVDGIIVGGKRIGHGRIDCMAMDSKKRMWACGVRNSLMLIEPNGTVRTIIRKEKKLGPRFLLLDHRGLMWMATDKGVFTFNPDQLLRNPKTLKQITDVPAKNLFEDSGHTLWIGTKSNGVYSTPANQATAKNPKFNHLTRADGLPSNVIQFITESSPGCLFIGTNNGCVWYQPKRRTFSHFLIPDNSALNFCNENSFARLDDGTMAVGTIDGIVYAEKRWADKTGNPHPLALTNVLVDGISVFAMGEKSPVKGDLGKLSEMRLPHDQNSITIEWSNFEFGNVQNVNYSYRLEGYDNDWSEASHLNFATYKELPPGTYSLSIRYSDNGSNWAMWPNKLKIVVMPPLWATWWAIMLYVMVAAAICFVVVRQVRRTQALRQSVAMEKQMTEFKLRFFTNISHEFRTPLTLIQVAMEHIKGSKKMPNELKLPVSNMQRSVDNMMRLVNQLLEFRKMQNGKLTLSVQPTNIATFVYNIYMNFYDMAATRGINYQFVPQRKEIDGYVDRSNLDKIVYNLLSNAFKYTPNGHDITIKLSVDDSNRLQITVSDTGIGIPPEKQATLFERYTTGKVSADSIGIGLNLTQELVRVHHGEIHYEENPGGGSRFIVTLPIGRDDYQSDELMQVDTGLQPDNDEEKEGFSEQYTQLMGEPLNDKRVLVVEDNSDIAGMLMKELGKYFHVDTATDGQQAWETLTAADGNAPKYDLVVTDVMMPRMDGFELVRRIRADRSLRHLPVVMLTALTAEEKQEKGLGVGADVYIAKPFSIKVLIAQCASLIHLREIMQHSFATKPSPKAEAPKILKDEKDKQFIEQLDTMIANHIGDQNLSVDTLAAMFGMGRTTFYRRVRQLTGKTPNTYINEARMHQAANMLKNENLNVSEVAYRVGINYPQYFAMSFKKMFGKTPSEYQKGE